VRVGARRAGPVNRLQLTARERSAVLTVMAVPVGSACLVWKTWANGCTDPISNCLWLGTLEADQQFLDLVACISGQCPYPEGIVCLQAALEGPCAPALETCEGE